MQPFNNTKDFLNAQATKSSSWDAFADDAQRNEQTNRRAFQAAVRVLLYLRENGKSKAWLAAQMEVTPQYVGKILKGGSNLTLGTIEKLEAATGLVLLTVPDVRTHRRRITAIKTVITSFFTETFPADKQPDCFQLA